MKHIVLIVGLFLFSSKAFSYDYRVDEDKFESTKTEWINDNNLGCCQDCTIRFQPIKVTKKHKSNYFLKVQYIATDWIFLKDGAPLKLLIDGKSMSLKPILSSSIEETEPGGIYEELQYSVSPKFFEKLALANKVEVKISGQHYYTTACFDENNQRNFDRFYQELILNQKYQEHKKTNQ